MQTSCNTVTYQLRLWNSVGQLFRIRLGPKVGVKVMHSVALGETEWKCSALLLSCQTALVMTLRGSTWTFGKQYDGINTKKLTSERLLLQIHYRYTEKTMFWKPVLISSNAPLGLLIWVVMSVNMMPSQPRMIHSIWSASLDDVSKTLEL